MSQATCHGARKLLDLTYNKLSFKHFEKVALWVGRLCRSANTTAESTQINSTDSTFTDSTITDSAAIADHWHLFTTINGQSGEQHHVASV